MFWSTEEAERRLAEVRGVPGVGSLTLNQTCGTLSLSYDPARLSARELREHWVRSDMATRVRGGHHDAARFGLRWMQLALEVACVLFATTRA